MKHNVVFLFLLLSSIASKAQTGSYQGHLWKISGNGLTQPSFLYGTMHVSNKVAFHLSDSFYKAIASVDVVALEINPETWMEVMTTDPYIADDYGNAFMERGDYQRDGLYKSIFQLKEPDNKQIGNSLSQELGILNSLLYRNSSAGADFQEDTYLDLFIYQAGKKQGKEITGLEKLGTTMRLSELAARPEKDKKKLKAERKEREKREHIVSKLLDGKPFGEVMEDAYRRGDLDLLDSLSRLSDGKKSHDYIIVYRNKIMANSMDSIMKEKSLFAGVGAAHLPNTYGVIDLLREKGYTVTAVDRTKTSFGQMAKDKLEETFLSTPMASHTSSDGLYSISMPGELYEFPESGNVMMAAYPDMPNGATYLIKRLFTYAPLYGKTQDQYLEKIDSLLFENIPGKILENKRIEIDGIPGFQIKNKTKKGDMQEYRIMVTPLEILIYKLGGKKTFAQRADAGKFFSDLTFNIKDGEWSSYSPRNTAYAVDLPGMQVFEGEKTEFMRGFWKKTVQSYDSKLGYFAVLNRSYSDSYIEVDSFELYHMCKFFFTNLKYQADEMEYTSYGKYNAFKAKGSKDSMPPIYLTAICKGDQYYLLVSQTDSEEAKDKFVSSFQFKDFTYRREFEVKHDTARMFSVYTNVKPPAERSYYRYYGGDEADDSHEEETKFASYYSKETNEAIFVRFLRYHKYASYENIDSLWSSFKRETKRRATFHYLDEKKWEEDGMYFYEMSVNDTGSNRLMYSRCIVKNGVSYLIGTELDPLQERTPFLDSFLTTFTPWDTAVGTPILESKADLFLSDLLSDDSTTREAAGNSWYVVKFEDEDVPKLIKAYEQHFKTEKGSENRKQILSELGRLEHPAILPFLQKTYAQVGDTVDFQMSILTALANQDTKKATSVLAKLILDETPLVSEQRVGGLFMNLSDSLELGPALFPDIHVLTALAEYKPQVYDLLCEMLDSNVIKAKTYKKQLKQITWQATNELKRQKASMDFSAKDFLEKAPRYDLYSYGDLLEDYIKLLAPHYKNATVRKFFDRVEKVNSPGLQMDVATLKVKYGIKVEDDIWDKFVENEVDIIGLYYRLKNIDRSDLFPENVPFEKMVRSRFAQAAGLNLYKDSLVFVSKEELVYDGDTGSIYFFKFKEKEEEDDDWEYGYLGLIDDANEALPEFKNTIKSDDISVNKFEDEALQLRMVKRELEMEDWRRYRVSDEPEFKELKNSRYRYYY